MASKFLLFLSLLLVCSNFSISLETNDENYESQCQQQQKQVGYEVKLDQHKEVQYGYSASTSPYYFPQDSFSYLAKTPYGHFRLAPRFFSQQTQSYESFESSFKSFNYRLGVFEANPNTFRVPYHWTADSLFYIVQGNAILTLVRYENRQAIFVKQGDIFRIPAGTTVYWINKSTSEKLQVVKLFRPTSQFGSLVGFSGYGCKNPQAYLRSFSRDILTSSFNVTSERFFEQQAKGDAFLQASQQQLVEITKISERVQTRRQQVFRPFNLLVKKPLHLSQHGQLYLANRVDYPQLQDLDVSLFNINRGSMMLPLYHSKATRIAYVLQGRGFFEMVRPEFQQVQIEQSEFRYQNFRANLSPGDIILIPAGFPFTVVAAQNENLQLLSFGIDSLNNEMHFLAGRSSIFGCMDTWAKELTFGCAAREAETLFGTQRESIFVPGPLGQAWQQQ